MHLPSSRRQILVIAAATTLTFVLLLLWQNQQLVRVASAKLWTFSGQDALDNEPLCRRLPGADNVLVVMKTGANEVQDKLTVHLRTTLTCYPHHIIFSDFEEDLPTGQHLYDAFKYTSTSLKETHPDFALWRKLRDEGRAGLLPSELSGSDSRETPEPYRDMIPGWHLDKWKFLPMMNQTFRMYPNMHWYVFVEADTYLMWSSLLAYLDTKSWTDDLYLGSRQSIWEVDFGQGGSGYLLSRAALEKVANLIDNNQDHWQKVTEQYWVGDHILAIALRDAGILLQDGRPAWQGLPVSSMDLSPKSGFWCSGTMTSHHQRPTEIEDLWNFEQTLISETARSTSAGGSEVVRYQDLFEGYVLPRIQQTRASWDNQADHSLDANVTSLQECQALCEKQGDCMQYAMHNHKYCRTSSKVVLGEGSERVESGWMLERIQAHIKYAIAC